MLVSKILFTEPLQADRLPLTAAGAVRWPGAARGTRRPLRAIAAAMMLHVTACALTLAFIREPPAPSPPDDQTVTLVFAAPEALPPPAAEPATPPDASVRPEATSLPPEPPATEAAPRETPPPAIAQPPEPPPPAPPRAEAKPVAPPKPPPNHRPAATARSAQPARVAEPSRAAEPAAAPHPAPAAAEAPVAADWQRSVAGWLAAHKVYPELALRRRVEGTVGLRFTADRSGRVLTVSLVSSAGSPLLDAAAEKMVGEATLPPFPAGMPQQTATLTVPIRYALSN
nr:energy transducer TonB [uncultured Rhodopila sp.]